MMNAIVDVNLKDKARDIKAPPKKPERPLLVLF